MIPKSWTQRVVSHVSTERGTRCSQDTEAAPLQANVGLGLPTMFKVKLVGLWRVIPSALANNPTRANPHRQGGSEVEVIAVRMASQTNLILGLTGARAIDAHRDKHVEISRERTGSPGIAQVSASIFLVCTG